MLKQRRFRFVAVSSTLALCSTLCGCTAISGLAAAVPSAAAQVLPANAQLVHTKEQFEKAAKAVRPGDTIILANGVWRDFEIVLTGQGTTTKPITLMAQTPGGVIISGQSNLRIGGRHIIVSGLVFKDGHSPTGEVISCRRNKADLASDSRITNVVIDRFNQPDRAQSDYWVAMYGKRNRFDHNSLIGKSNVGVTLAVRLDSEESRENGHRIDSNYFGPRPSLGSNGGETIRIGTSTYSMFDSKTVIENNVFDRCDGEVEIVSVKSGANIVRGNLFLESRGSVVLRHGDGNVVERNVFLGKGKDHTGGVRVINRNQIVRGNYIEGSRGTGFASALTVMNGVPNSPVNRYVQVSNATIEQNTIVDSARISLAAGSDAERSAAPVDSVMASNLFSFTGAGTSIEISDDISGIALSDNVIVTPKPVDGLAATRRDAVPMERGANGLQYPIDPALASVGAPRDLKVVSLDEVGADYYAKPSRDGGFATGKVHRVGEGEAAIVSALSQSAAGDQLLLTEPEYVIERTLLIDKAISIKGADGVRPIIKFTRSSLFEIGDGGSLQLKALVIDGADAPDSVGNSVIRTSATPILTNFLLDLDDVTITNLSVNKSFNVITFGKGAMADGVTIKNSEFSMISGSVVAADAETDDFGRYNIEYLTINSSRFDAVQGFVVTLYRGGNDESTFGPHFVFDQNRVSNSGSATMAALKMHGVQDAVVSNNQFVNSAPIAIVQTTGTPIMRITDNRFQSTPKPVTSRMKGTAPIDWAFSGNSFNGQGQ